ncbi:MAG: glycine cleavage T C-terminal barrel domain-containing protein [Vicinamibacterales bacterium]
MPGHVSHSALLNSALVVTHGDAGLVRVSGPDRATWLQGLLSNDVEALAPGHGCYTAWLTPQGRMLTDAVVLAERDSLTLELPALLAAPLFRQLTAAIFAEDVVAVDESAMWRTVGVYGTHAAEVIARVLVGSRARASGSSLRAETLDAWPEYAHAGLPPDGRMYSARTFGVSGYVLRVPADQTDLWASRLRLAGGVLAAPDAIEYARIEAGRPQFLVDMDADTIPLEAGIEDRAISFTKGCYVGQEVVVRVLHRGGGRVARKLVGLALDGPDVPQARAPISSERGEIGRVTSAAWSPRLLRAVALAYVHRDFIAPGTAVTVQCGRDAVAATVKSFPIE